MRADHYPFATSHGSHQFILPSCTAQDSSDAVKSPLIACPTHRKDFAPISRRNCWNFIHWLISINKTPSASSSLHFLSWRCYQYGRLVYRQRFEYQTSEIRVENKGLERWSDSTVFSDGIDGFPKGCRGYSGGAKDLAELARAESCSLLVRKYDWEFLPCLFSPLRHREGSAWNT